MAAATPNTDEPLDADQLRRRANRRLLGASVLLLIAIIAVPMLLEREPPPLPDNVEVRIPPVEGTRFDPKLPDARKGGAERVGAAVVDEPSGAAAAPERAAASAPPEPAAATPAAPVAAVKPPETAAEKSSDKTAPKGRDRPEERPALRPPDKAPEKAAAKAAEKATGKSATAVKAAEAPRKAGQLAVQVVAVRDAAAARQVHDRAKALKFPVYTERIDVANGVVIRVRVGPYDNKAAAETARARLAQAGFEAKVVTLQ